MAPLPPLKPVPLPELERRESPNQSRRLHGAAAVDLILVHTPEGSFRSALSTCMAGVSRSVRDEIVRQRPDTRLVSYHVLISEGGSKGVQLVPWDRKAWHAGVFNSRSDGVALADRKSVV